MKKSVNQLLRGFFRLQVVDATGKVRQDTGWLKNLILNQGLDAVVDRSFADNFTHCCLGTDATPTAVDSGATTVAQSNVTVTLAGGSFQFTNTLDDAGKIIKWDTGQTATISDVTSTTTATVFSSATIGAGEFTVYQVTQTGLLAEVHRSNTYYTEGNACQTVVTPPSAVALQRTFVFPTEVAPATYNEVGVSYSGTPGDNLFSRMVLAAPLEVPEGMYARVIYVLNITLSPSSATAKTADVPGWPISPATNTDGFDSLEDWGLYGIISDGSKSPIRTVSAIPILGNEPSENCDVLVSSDTQALSSPGSPVMNRWQTGALAASMSMVEYTPGSFTRLRSYQVVSNQGNMTNLRTLAMGHIIDGTNFLPTYTFLFTQNQTKTGSYLIELYFRLTWGRQLA